MGNLWTELLKLSPAQRLRLAEELWDSVASEQDSLLLTNMQRAEIERRLADHARDPGSALSWDKVRKRLWSKI